MLPKYSDAEVAFQQGELDKSKKWLNHLWQYKDNNNDFIFEL